MGRTTGNKQIRVSVEKTAYTSLKEKAKSLGMTLEHYAGLVLSGYKIEKVR